MREVRKGVVLMLVGALAATSASASSQEERRAILAPTSDFSRAERWEALQGGSGTNQKRFDREAYSLPAANLGFEGLADFSVGNGLFRRLWVSAPSSTRSADGLGPLYNARSCQRCHLKDGRGHPPEGPDDGAVSFLLRLAIPGAGSDGQPSASPDLTYGGQLQDLAIQGIAPEGKIVVSHSPVPVELGGGETAELLRPTYTVANLGYGPLAAGTRLSPRVAPPMIGLGLLEAIPEAEVLANADSDDADGDGISGRAPRVWSKAFEKEMLGRFGWKAAQATVEDQASGAMSGDIGVSSPLFPAPYADCTEAQAPCRDAIHGDDEMSGGFEASAKVMDAIVFYSRHLAVPARRKHDDPTVLRGKALFYGAGCTGCHTPKFSTAGAALSEPLANQLIWPYTDLLLHDMGEGLADHAPEGGATGREWRTPPLWGIGLTETVNGHTRFLHDGRARNLTEAILWHDGEAAAAKERFRTMPRPDRDALIAFLNSL